MFRKKSERKNLSSLHVRVQFPPSKEFKVLILEEGMTGHEVLEFVGSQVNIDQIADYGMFIPPNRKNPGCWVKEDQPLSSYNIQNQDVVEFKKKHRPMRVALPNETYRTVLIDDTACVKDLVIPILNKIGEKEVEELPEGSSETRDVRLRKKSIMTSNPKHEFVNVEFLKHDLTLREQGVTGDATVVLFKRRVDGELTYDMCLQFPNISGYLLQRKVSRVRRGWKKRWFSLRKDKLYYGMKPDQELQRYIPIQVVSLVQGEERIPGMPKKYAGCGFQVITQQRVFYFLSTNVRDMYRWVEALETCRKMFAGDASFWTSRYSSFLKGIQQDDDESSDFRFQDREDGVPERSGLPDDDTLEEEDLTESIPPDLGDYTEADKRFLVRTCNDRFSKDEKLDGKIPIEEEGNDLFQKARDGVLCSKLFNSEFPGVLDEDELKTDPDDVPGHRSNIEACLESAKDMGCSVTDVEVDDVLAGKPAKVLRLMMETMKTGLHSSIVQEAEIHRLCRPGEDLSHIMQMSLEELLLRWCNYHLAKVDRSMSNFAEDIRDGVNYTYILNQIAPDDCDLDALKEADPKMRAQRVIDDAKDIGARACITPDDIVEGNARINVLFVASLFQAAPGLHEDPEEDMGDYDDDDTAYFVKRINHALRDDPDVTDKVPINPETKDLFRKAKDGVVMCKLFEERFPGSLPIQQMHLKPKTTEERLENLNLCIDSVENRDSNVVGDVDAEEVAVGRAQSVLRLVWKIEKAKLSAILLAQPFVITLVHPKEDLVTLINKRPEEVLLRWINSHLDPSQNVLSFSTDLMGGDAYSALLKSIGADLDDQDDTSTPEARAQGIISAASKLLDGPCFLSPKDICEGRHRPNLLFVGQLFDHYTRTMSLEPEGLGEFTHADKAYFTRHIDAALCSGESDNDLWSPMDPGSDDLFLRSPNGLLLCKFINHEFPKTIDERVLNVGSKGTKPNAAEVLENINVCLNSAKALGCTTSVEPSQIVTGKASPIMGLIWDVLDARLANDLSLTNHPELELLMGPDEDSQIMQTLSAEEKLVRWANHHLQRAGFERTLKDLSADGVDARMIGTIMNQVKPDVCGLEVLAESDPEKQAELVLENTKAMGASTFAQPRDIASGNPRINKLLMGSIFCASPPLSLEPRDDGVEYEAPSWMNDFRDESREERAFRVWINSLGLSATVDNLFEDLKDGRVLLMMIDSVHPGLVDWKKVNTDARSIYKKVENCNYVIELAKGLGMTIINLGGKDIAEGSRKLTLAIVWQIVRHGILDMLKRITLHGKSATEDDVLEWANERVKRVGKQTRISSFQDSSLHTSHFLINLLYSCRPSSIDYGLVYPGENETQCEENAKYTISVAWKVGVPTFILWEDIVQVKPKMILVFCAMIMSRFEG
eukprot:TRINITY_DN8670_c0_g3_i2.p1 TRINITY_DN8670_c0_g3~~TRINITY_DN8670_c0_g3_i2.p1  ORF type:complete len:1395 (-),score=360.20 TRINITY_DN8670_c0_g3_i2:56-4240(-)